MKLTIRISECLLQNNKIKVAGKSHKISQDIKSVMIDGYWRSQERTPSRKETQRQPCYSVAVKISIKHTYNRLVCPFTEGHILIRLTEEMIGITKQTPRLDKI